MGKYLTTTVLVILVGCVRPQMIVQKRLQPISPSQVQVFVEEPKADYETLAIISITVDEGQSFVDFALKHMKNSAASIGGNGLLLQQGQGTSQGGMAIPLGQGMMFALVNGQTIHGKVIRLK